MYQISAIPKGWYEQNKLLDIQIDSYITARRIQKESGIVQYVMIADRGEFPITKDLFEGIYDTASSFRTYNIDEYNQYKYLDEDCNSYEVLDKVTRFQF